jgi:hypothetical protein
MSNDMMTESQRILLASYADGQCNWFDRIRAERLLSVSSDARGCLADLRALSKQVQEAYRVPNSSFDNLWQRVSARIDQEERAELFLGKRAPARSWGWSLGDLRSWAYGSSLAAVVVTAALLIMLPASKQPVGYALSAQGAAQNLMPVSLEKQAAKIEKFTRPQILPDRYVDAMEVDWVKGQGRVRLMQSPDGSSPIMWIKRQPGVQARRQVPAFDVSALQSLSGH